MLALIFMACERCLIFRARLLVKSMRLIGKNYEAIAEYLMKTQGVPFRVETKVDMTYDPYTHEQIRITTKYLYRSAQAGGREMLIARTALWEGL